MKFLCAFLVLVTFVSAQAADNIKWYFNNEEITKVIELYSKAAGQKFVVDPTVRGKISIFLPEPISIEEAFNQLSSALALNGFAISKQGDTMVVISARNSQRSLNPVSAERPALKPERMATWVYTAKYISVERISSDLRIIPSRDGEMSIDIAQNRIILSDWSSNINRVADLFALLDKPADPAAAKLYEASKKEWEKVAKEREQQRRDRKAEHPSEGPAGEHPPPPSAPKH